MTPPSSGHFQFLVFVCVNNRKLNLSNLDMVHLICHVISRLCTSYVDYLDSENVQRNLERTKIPRTNALLNYCSIWGNCYTVHMYKHDCALRHDLHSHTGMNSPIRVQLSWVGESFLSSSHVFPQFTSSHYSNWGCTSSSSKWFSSKLKSIISGWNTFNWLRYCSKCTTPWGCSKRLRIWHNSNPIAVLSLQIMPKCKRSSVYALL